MKRGAAIRHLLLSAVAAAAITPTLSPALAQTPADGRLDIIIVTAQQREENLQDVPVSAATLSDDSLDAIFSGGEDVLALAARVPSVYAESSNGRVAPRFYIRGLGNTDFDLAASQPVSIIMDDVVMENVVLKSTPIFDLDRVEVYRGPQGTLFGRNTTAGVIRFTSAKPSQQTSMQGSASYGTYGSVSAEGGVGGAITEGLSARISGLWQRRDDWIDNTTQPGRNNLGGFNEYAGRIQVLAEPTDRFSALFNLHGRNLDGTAAVFRANVIDQGRSGLNARYERDRVSFDGGDGNPQEYKGWGASAKLEYDFDGATLTSISAYENTTGRSRGDIDGSAGPYTFNFTGPFRFPEIPFPSDTQDSIDDLDQVTQELRLASNGDGPWSWQLGAYWFDSSVTITTVGPAGFPPPSTLTHENTAWAVFGQTSYNVTDALSLTAGVRWTDDEKSLTVLGAPANNREISDDQASWEVSALYSLSDDVNVYGRVASGFRGPSIQGRDVAFFAPPSVAQSETVLSYEAGIKSSLMGDTLRLNGAVFTYEVSDIQLTAVGGAANTVQLINADKGEAWGVEVDAEFAPTDNLVFTGGLSYVDSEINDPGLAVGICAQCTVTDPTRVLGGARRALIDGNPFPNAPELIGNFTARYSYPLANGGELFAFTDWAYQGDTNLLLYQSIEYQTSDQFEGGLKFGWARQDGSLEFAVFGRNITDEDNIKGGIDFNNNTAFVNEPRIIGVSVSARR